MSDRLRNLVFIPLYIPAMPAVAVSLSGRGPLSLFSAFGMGQRNGAVVPQESCRDTSGVLSVFDHDQLSSDDYLGSVEIPLKVFI